jgi:hypothetical protein
VLRIEPDPTSANRHYAIMSDYLPLLCRLSHGKAAGGICCGRRAGIWNVQ